MYRICYVIGQLDRGGAEKQLYALLRSLNRELFEPIVISFDARGYWAGEIRKLGVQVIETGRRRHKEIGRLLQLVRLLRRLEPAVVHTYLFPANTYGRAAAIVARVPIIIASERNLPEVGRGMKRSWVYIDKLLSFFSHAVLCNSHRARRLLVENYAFNPRKVITIHNGIEVSNGIASNNSVHLAAEEKVVGTVARLYPQKNLEMFLRMVRIVLDRYHDSSLKFMIIGDGPLRKQLEQRAVDLGVDKAVTFTGQRHDVAELLRNLDVYVNTSDYEGLSNAIMEAMTSELPVVATEVGGADELIRDGETGFLCPPNDAATMASKVIDLLENEAKARRMAACGRSFMAREFGMTKMVRGVERIYLDSLRHSHPQDHLEAVLNYHEMSGVGAGAQ